jgi:hypothetical protein
MKRNLDTTGLSMSQAQSISNLCNQRAQNIDAELAVVNNASKEIRIDGLVYVIEDAKPLPADIQDLLLKKGKLHALQAFLMEAIRSKDFLLLEIKNRKCRYTVNPPVKKEAQLPLILPTVEESWGWAQLTEEEHNLFLEQEALAAHFGQFIHKGGILTTLRNQIAKLPGLEWMTVREGEKTPVTVKKHHTSDDLNRIHEELAKKHREYEQKVNYFKAKVKNWVTLENAAIAKKNADALSKYQQEDDLLHMQYVREHNEWSNAREVVYQEFEIARQEEIQEVAALKIKVDPRFQELVTELLEK